MNRSCPRAIRIVGTHLADYEIPPLFEQFGRPAFVWTEAQKESSEIAISKAISSRHSSCAAGRQNVGYVRGSSEDGGWFYRYQKRFPTLAVEAVHRILGERLPEENRTVALTISSTFNVP